MADFEQGLLNFLKLQNEPQSLADRNEATTRLHLINQIIVEALAWDLASVSCEVSLRGEYADYILGNPRRLAIWEAKREGVHFELPQGFNKTVCKLRTLQESSVPLSAAVDQVLSYCQAHGVGVAVICNGHQVIAFIASRHDGVPPREGNALCFLSMEDIGKNFRLFWDNLSKPGLESQFIYKTLRAEGTPLPPEKLSAKIATYPGIKNRNEQQST